MSRRVGTASSPLRVAVVGAGPAGFYTADALFRREDVHVRVDMFNRLPNPYGLVREGVAPDHPSIKAVTRVFDRICGDERFRFFGNVTIGTDVTTAELLGSYHAVVYATGAQSDRRLGIPGEGLAGSHPATVFVGWYNGHPDCADLEFDLSHPRAVVIGNGNVAVDVARILVRRPDELAVTDIADHALTALRDSAVRDVVMLGRRGPAQAKFTSAELKEFGKLDGLSVHVDPAALELDEESAAAVAAERRVSRNLEILADFASRASSDDDEAGRRLELRFFTSPIELLGRGGRVAGVRVERNRLEAGADGRLRAVGTGDIEEIECGLVLRSVGYRGVPLPGVPFDEARGVIPNDAGRVLSAPGGPARPREYAVGWIKRGPSGIIGTNKPDAVETVSSLLDDAASGSFDEQVVEPGTIEELLVARDVRVVTYEDWCRIDAAETERGEAQGRPRCKFVSVDEMLRAAGLAAGSPKL